MRSTQATVAAASREARLLAMAARRVHEFELPRLVAAPRQGARVGQPEAAREEGPLRPGQPVDGAGAGGGVGVRAVAEYETLLAQLVADGLDRPVDPRVVRRQEPDAGDEQE